MKKNLNYENLEYKKKLVCLLKYGLRLHLDRRKKTQTKKNNYNRGIVLISITIDKKTYDRKDNDVNKDKHCDDILILTHLFPH